LGSTSTSTRARDSGSSFTVVSMPQRTLERAETWVFTGAPGRVISLSADLALAVPLLIAYGARRAWRRVARRSSDDDQSSAA
jgi:hypothetical protein